MTRRFKVGVVAALAAAALVSGPMLGAEAWAGKKSSIKAKINDAKFKANRKPGATAAGAAYDNITGGINIVGGSAKLSGRGLNTRAEVKLLTLTTVVGDLLTATYPLTVPVELATFSRIVTEGVGVISTEIWAGEGVTLTINSYKDGRIKGTFSGVIPAEEAASDAIVEDGKFSILLNAPAI